jgi:hypothetical protein
MVYILIASHRDPSDVEDSMIFWKPQLKGGVPLLKLAHTNHQLRTEYRPLALCQRRIRVTGKHFKKFLQDFFPFRERPGSHDRKIRGLHIT